MSVKFTALKDRTQPNGKNSMDIFIEGFDEAEAKTGSELEIILPIQGKSVSFQVVIANEL